MTPFELGSSVEELVHVISERGLKLSSKCSVQLSHPSRHDSLTIASSQQNSDLNQSWVGRGDGLRLYIRLATDGLVVDGTERQDLLEELSTIIRDSQVLCYLEPSILPCL